MIQKSIAETTGEISITQFTPVENLMPDQRQAVFESLSQMTKGAELDWDRIAVGVDENGKIVILQKTEVAGGGSAGSPSSFGRAASAGSPSSFGMAATGSPSTFKMAKDAESAE